MFVAYRKSRGTTKMNNTDTRAWEHNASLPTESHTRNPFVDTVGEALGPSIYLISTNGVHRFVKSRSGSDGNVVASNFLGSRQEERH